MRSVSNGNASSADVCPKCERPKATPHDAVRWLTNTGHHAEVCWDGVDYLRITPDEEAVPGAAYLKERLIELRKQRDRLACAAIAGVKR